MTLSEQRLLAVKFLFTFIIKINNAGFTSKDFSAYCQENNLYKTNKKYISEFLYSAQKAAQDFKVVLISQNKKYYADNNFCSLYNLEPIQYSKKQKIYSGSIRGITRSKTRKGNIFSRQKLSSFIKVQPLVNKMSLASILN
jgi:hypothetical protein